MRQSDRTRACQHLDNRAEVLARRHQRRLNEMTESALSSAQHRRHQWFAPQPALALATISVAVLAWWMVPLTDDAPTYPSMAVQMATIPNWVLDDEVPLELLESPEFYHWLAEQTAPSKNQEEENAQQG